MELGDPAPLSETDLPADGHLSAGISILPGRSLLHGAGCAAPGK